MDALKAGTLKALRATYKCIIDYPVARGYTLEIQRYGLSMEHQLMLLLDLARKHTFDERGQEYINRQIDALWRHVLFSN